MKDDWKTYATAFLIGIGSLFALNYFYSSDGFGIWLVIMVILFAGVIVPWVAEWIPWKHLQRIRDNILGNMIPWKDLPLKSKVLIVWLGMVLILVLYVPCYKEVDIRGTTHTISWGYRFLPLLGADANLKINFSLVFMEIIAGTVMCSLAYVILQAKK
ncbi:hypothetical protein [Candidatus Nitronereus thalassa]|uniref:Uncharacterized protein n=1 Tax=Candidatus Nitronereus thalassa TaxID=3020898 RepID=A0ABU3K8Z6_9BACT|nr:hypothetical protein [Candidatus Nitronereus thalassa]MDT7042925.1 hypothetical protein [Candidatus Nitronereus thalassa]